MTITTTRRGWRRGAASRRTRHWRRSRYQRRPRDDSPEDNDETTPESDDHSTTERGDRRDSRSSAHHHRLSPHSASTRGSTPRWPSQNSSSRLRSRPPPSRPPSRAVTSPVAPAPVRARRSAFGLVMISRLAGASSKAGRPRGLVLVPTRELAAQVTGVLAPLARAMGVKVAAVYGGADRQAQIVELQRGVDIIVATPLRLADLVRTKDCMLDAIEIVCVDEADRMADQGFPSPGRVAAALVHPRAPDAGVLRHARRRHHGAARSLDARRRRHRRRYPDANRRHDGASLLVGARDGSPSCGRQPARRRRSILPVCGTLAGPRVADVGCSGDVERVAVVTAELDIEHRAAGVGSLEDLAALTHALDLGGRRACHPHCALRRRGRCHRGSCRAPRTLLRSDNEPSAATAELGEAPTDALGDDQGRAVGRQDHPVGKRQALGHRAGRATGIDEHDRAGAGELGRMVHRQHRHCRSTHGRCRRRRDRCRCGERDRRDRCRRPARWPS